MTTGNGEHCVLLVDDDDAFRKVLGGELTRRGHPVLSAADGNSALIQ